MKNRSILIAALSFGLAVPSSAQYLNDCQKKILVLWDRPYVSLSFEDVPKEVHPYLIKELQDAASANKDSQFKNLWMDPFKDLESRPAQEQQLWLKRWWETRRQSAKDAAPRLAEQLHEDEDDLLEAFEDGTQYDKQKGPGKPLTRAIRMLDMSFFQAVDQARYHYNIACVTKK